MIHLKQHNIKSNGRSRLIALFSLLVLFALFPYGWLADKWPAFDRFTGFIFDSEAAHIAGHVGLFVLLGTAVLLVFPRLLQKPALYLGIVAWIAILQEYLQLASFKNRPVMLADLFDVAVDLFAAGIIFIILSRQKRHETI